MHQWFQKCLDNLSTLWKRREEKTRNEVEELIWKWEQLSSEKMNKVFSSDMSILRIQTRLKTINEYRKFLQLIVDHFENDKQLSPYVLKSEIYIVLFRDFFLDQKGYYVNAVEETESFKQSVISFLKLYEKARFAIEPSFNTEHNVSRTSTYVGELNQLLEVFER